MLPPHTRSAGTYAQASPSPSAIAAAWSAPPERRGPRSTSCSPSTSAPRLRHAVISRPRSVGVPAPIDP